MRKLIALLAVLAFASFGAHASGVTNVLLALKGSGGTPPSSAIWSQPGTLATISGGGLTATSNTATANFQSGPANESVTGTSKIVFEATIGTVLTNTPGIGIGNGSFAVNAGAFLGIDANGIGYYPLVGSVFLNSVDIAGGAWTHATPGDKIVVAFDVAAGKVWFWNPTSGKWNNDILANQNPATGTGGITHGIVGALFPAFCVASDGVSTTFLTARFTLPLSIATPSGYSGMP